GQELCFEAAVGDSFGLQIGMKAHSAQTNRTAFGGKLADLFQTGDTRTVFDEILAEAIQENSGDKYRIRILDAIPVDQVYRGQIARVSVFLGAMQHDLGA